MNSSVQVFASSNSCFPPPSALIRARACCARDQSLSAGVGCRAFGISRRQAASTCHATILGAVTAIISSVYFCESDSATLPRGSPGAAFYVAWEAELNATGEVVMLRAQAEDHDKQIAKLKKQPTATADTKP